MTYDEGLAGRVRDALASRRSDQEPADERRMFGGLAFLVGGRMALAVSGGGGLVVRVDQVAAPALLEQDGVTPVEMRGRPTRGWLRVAPDRLEDVAALDRWVGLGLDAVRSLG